VSDLVHQDVEEVLPIVGVDECVVGVVLHDGRFLHMNGSDDFLSAFRLGVGRYMLWFKAEGFYQQVARIKSLEVVNVWEELRDGMFQKIVVVRDPSKHGDRVDATFFIMRTR
jgi:hypothetical protein